VRDLLSEAYQHLQDSGGRMTAERRAVLESLENLGGHPTAEQIYLDAKERHPDLNPSTVYRTLNWLANAGLLSSRRFDSGPGPEQYDPGQGEHHHFVCQECGKVEEFSTTTIDMAKRDFSEAHGCIITSAELRLTGICRSCLEAGASLPTIGAEQFAPHEKKSSESLCSLQSGAAATVTALSGGHAFCSRVANLGFTAGAEVTMLQNYGSGPLIVAVRGVRVALGREEADKVLVHR
jgi:Fe2+ or Zn2+ uptake regulation protein/Fe2+ transport system protein FeoA